MTILKYAMFSTFKSNGAKNYMFVDLSTNSIGRHAGGYTRNACDTCRAKKLRCSGETPLCQRCESLSSVCLYSSRESRRQKRRREAIDPKNDLESTSKRERPSSTIPENTEYDLGSTIDNGSAAWYYGDLDLDLCQDVHLNVPLTPLLQSAEVTPTGDYNQFLDLNSSSPTPTEDAVSTEEAVSVEWTPSDVDITMGSDQTQAHLASHYEFASGQESPSLTSIPSDDCSCLKTMVIVLENAGDCTDSTPLDGLMSIAGHSIFQCNEIISCINCSARFPTLLANIMQQLATVFNRISKLFLQQNQLLPNTGDGILAFNFSVGKYQVENEHMKRQLLHHLIMLQLHEFYDLLNKLKLHSGLKQNSLGMVSTVEEEIKIITRSIRNFLDDLNGN